MKKGSPKMRSRAVREEMRPEYDFSAGVRGKYARRYAAASNVDILDPDVAEVFPDSRSVNDALRALAAIVRRRRPHRKARAS
jgi:hypothetical protein